MQDSITSIQLAEEEDLVISQDDIHTSYEPSLNELNRYAIHLGMNPEEDEALLYIAKKGLTAAIPAPWKACQTKDNQIYYFNFETGESQWEHPCDQDFRNEYKAQKELIAKNVITPQNQSQRSEDKLTFSIHSNNEAPQEFAIGDITVSLGINSQEQSHIGSSNRSSNVLNYSHHTGSQNPQSIRDKNFNFLEDYVASGVDDKNSAKESFCFSQEPEKQEVLEPLKQNTDKFEQELQAELVKYEQELSAKFNGVVSECKEIYENEQKLFQSRFQQNQQDQRLDNIIQEIEICDLEIEAIEAMEQDRDLLDQETEKDCEALGHEFTNERQTIEQKNIVILDQQLQSIRIQEISNLEAEKNKIHKEILKHELERGELEVFLENQKEQLAWNQTQRTLMEDNDHYLLNEKERMFKKADQIIRLFEISETQKRSQQEESDALAELTVEIQQKIDILEEDKFSYAEELREALHQYKRELDKKAETRKSNFERAINESIQVMHREVEVLRKHLLGKERAIQSLCEFEKEYFYAQGRENEREEMTNQVLLELEDIELQINSLAQEAYGYQVRIDKQQETVSFKNYLLQTVNTIQKQIEGLELEIAQQQSRALRKRSENALTEPNDSSSHINLKRLLKGFEGSRNAKNIVILFTEKIFTFDNKDPEK